MSVILACVYRLAIFVPISIALFASACSDDDPEVCIGVAASVPEEPVTHFPVGTEIQWSTNPPVTGDHFEHWAKWDRHYTTLPRGFYVHGAEHGGVALLYNCPDGCADIVDSLLDIVREYPADPQVADPPNPFFNCVTPVRNRLIVAADPLLPAGVQVAAVAWNNSYTASCFNEDELVGFINEHYGKGTEAVCADGLLDEVGGEFIDP
jgi:hypothetical protein